MQTRRQLLESFALAPLAGCALAGDTGSAPPVQRSWRMGFSHLPPRGTVAEVLRTIALWAPRAELAIIHEELPWTELLAGAQPEALLIRDKLQLVEHLRSKSLQLVFVGEVNNGLARESEAPQLVAAGRSITEPAIQRLYRDYMLAVARVLAPERMLLAAETNLIRAAAPTAVYSAVVQTCAALAGELRAAAYAAPIGISVQVETAWGRLGAARSYVGIDTDLRDFAFTGFIGLSSYPYLAWRTPEEIPEDWYSRLRGGSRLPMLVSEGGWSSARTARLRSSPALQARYLRRHADLLDSVSALAWLQIPFTDIDLAKLPGPIPANLPLFTALGLVDAHYRPKPALAVWDRLHARPLAQPLAASVQQAVSPGAAVR